MSFAKALQYEDIKPKKPSKEAVTKEAKYVLSNFSDSQLLWHLVVKHKFGLLATFTVTYVAFSLFGTVIVGLLEGIK